MSTSVILLNAFPDKKIKSLGNKYLLKLDIEEYLIDYKIQLLNYIYQNPEIILVNGFDNKKLEKYISKNYKNITFISHDFSNKYNIGKSILHGLSLSSKESCLLLHSSVVLTKEIKDIISKPNSCVFIQKNSNKSQGVGCVVNNDLVINCYYGLTNHMYDILYIDKKDMHNFKDIVFKTKNIEKLFLFEIVNLCIENNIEIIPNFINKKLIHIIDNHNTKLKNLKYV